MQVIFIDGNKENFEALLENAIHRAWDKKETDKLNSDKVYTVNQIAKRTGKAHPTIKKLIANGQLRATKDGKITEKALNEYLGNI